MTPLVIGIAGGSGSGKTTVANRILGHLDPSRIVVLQHDAYYRDISFHGGLGPEEVNFDHPNALETDLMVRHVCALRAGQAVEQPVYDFATHRRLGSTRRIEPREIIFVDGILILADRDLRDLMDIRLYVDTDADERLIRRIRRDIQERGRSLESVMQQYMATVKPMHQQFVEPSKVWADIIIPWSMENAVAIEMVVRTITTMLAADPARATSPSQFVRRPR